MIKRVIDAINGEDDTRWIHEQIVRITTKLNAPEIEAESK